MTTLKEALRDPQAWRSWLAIDTARGPRQLRDVLEDWQESDFLACDNGWRQAIGLATDPSRPTFRYSFLERPRGHSKSSDAAIMTAWALAAATSRRSGILVACDRDQGRLLRNAVASLVSVNPQLRRLLDVQQDRIVNSVTGSEAIVLSNDVPSSWGLLVNFSVCDEWSHAPTSGLWESIWSTLGKKENAYCQLQSNAGFSGSWQEEIYEAIRTDPDWYFSSLDGPKASWITQRTLDAQRRILPDVVFRRTWLNEWTSGLDAALPPELIAAAITLDGPVQRPNELFRRLHSSIVAVDVGVKRDRSAVIVLSVPHGEKSAHVTYARTWSPPRGGEIDLQAVEDEVLRVSREYGALECRYDPHQCAHIAQRLRRRGARMVEVPFSAGNLQSMAEATISGFQNSQFALYPHAELQRDLAGLTIQETPNRGYRLIAKKQADSHSDLGIALTIAAPRAIELVNASGVGAWSKGVVSRRIEPESTRRFNLLHKPQMKLGRRVYRHPDFDR
jgi:phage terminase large subunit-like protein